MSCGGCVSQYSLERMDTDRALPLKGKGGDNFLTRQDNLLLFSSFSGELIIKCQNLRNILLLNYYFIKPCVIRTDFENPSIINFILISSSSCEKLSNAQ